MDDSFAEYVQDQLHDLKDVRLRRMFGGHGLYQGETFFAILHKDRLYFKTDAATRPEYAARKMKPFRASATQTLRNYYEVPPDVLEESALLVEWAHSAVTVAKARAAKRTAKRVTRKTT